MNIGAESIGNFIRLQGWTDYGIVSGDDLKAALEIHEGVFERWLERGFQADMHYLETMREDRYHPENKLPEIRSVIVLQAWYGSEVKQEKGVVARYARGRDYHKILRKKLIALSDWLKKQDDSISNYLSVDSGPTVDRVMGEVAGLGFFGKNANLINPSRGSYFFIASLMTTAQLPLTERRRMPGCGDCRKCVVACPTQAIVAPGVIDARRCISYLTIENKGGIPIELRHKIGDRLFGCDICQEVCPFNEGRAGKQEIRISDLKAEHGVGDHLDLAEILTIKDDKQFLERFAGTPLMRAKRRGLQRNACVVAGNMGDRNLLPVLEAFLLRESDEMLREHADWAIRKLRAPVQEKT